MNKRENDKVQEGNIIAVRDEEIAESKLEQDRQGKLTFTEKEIETIRNTVASNANTHELNMFLSIAKRYGLDPFNKEIFFWKYKGQVNIMTSRDGYLKIADRHPQFDGLVSDVVREHDSFKRISDGINHEYGGTNRGKLIGAYALVYRKDRKYPVYVFAPFEEYNADSKVWRQYPSAMILKVAESMALKRAFTVSGLVSREEMEVAQLEESSSSPRFISKEGYDKGLKESGKDAQDNFQDKAKGDGNDGELVEDGEAEADNLDERLSDRERTIRDMIGNSIELKKELFEYLSLIKEKEGLGRVGLDDLSDRQFDELVQLLNDVKAMIDRSA